MSNYLCWKCKRPVPWTLHERDRTRDCNGVEVKYIEKYGKCNVCGSEIWVPGLDDQNEEVCREAYDAIRG